MCWIQTGFGQWFMTLCQLYDKTWLREAQGVSFILVCEFIEWITTEALSGYVTGDG